MEKKDCRTCGWFTGTEQSHICRVAYCAHPLAKCLFCPDYKHWTSISKEDVEEKRLQMKLEEKGW